MFLNSVFPLWGLQLVPIERFPYCGHTAVLCGQAILSLLQNDVFNYRIADFSAWSVSGSSKTHKEGIPSLGRPKERFASLKLS